MEKSEFLSFLVDETMKLSQEEKTLTELERKFSDYKLSYLRGQFMPHSQVLRFNTPFGLLDIPINWNLFSAEVSHQLLDETHDQDAFYSVMKSAWKTPLEKILIMHADGFSYLVALKAGEDFYIHDLLNQQEWLKAA